MEMKAAIEIFKLNLLAYPNSADAHYKLADAYLQVGEKALARQYAEKTLAMIDSHAAPLSSWSDTEQRRAEIRSAVLDLLKKLGATALLIIVLGLLACGVWLFLKDNVDFDQWRKDTLRSINGERTKVQEAMSDLPPGETHKIARPPGPPSTWPPVGPAARA